jgi:DNA helicase-2/ATP-dependent DNA helicase PcrA
MNSVELDFKNLNQPQFEAVNHSEGPLLVLAGAGTGKTKVLTSRIVRIVNSYLASPLQIMAVTFTNKAASEMKKRIGEVIGDQVNNLWIGTFHSLAAKILRRNPETVGLKSDFTIIDEDDQIRLLKQILTDFNIDQKQFPAKSYLYKISRFKDQVISCKEVKNSEKENFLPKLSEVYETYQYRMKSMNAVDFGDILFYNLEIFKNSAEILSYYQQKFRYILVDEYQDTNNAQYRWLLYLSASHQNICCVGDDDQSIYSWRGANIANILRFEKDFSNAKIVRLEQNYRSSPNILKVASSIISKNKERHQKTLWTNQGQAEKVKLFSFNDDRMEASSIANLIKQSTYTKSQIAVLVRAGYQTRSFEEAFIQNSISYKVVGGMKFYERMEIRDCLAYLRICSNLNDDLALGRIINVPKRGVGDATISSFYQKSKEEKTSLFLAMKLQQENSKGKAREVIGNFITQIENWHNKVQNISNLGDFAREILNDVGYIQMWKNDVNIDSQGRLENIEEFINSLSEFSNITEFLEYVSLIEARDDNQLGEMVNVMTVHAAKGLEFDLVFIPGLEDSVFPSAKSLDNKEAVEEERRLMYVATTRAKKRLILSFAKSRYVYGDYQMQAPSRFLKEIPESEIDFEEYSFSNNYFQNNNFQNFQTKNSQSFKAKKEEDSLIGKRVFHQKFGYGKVIEIDGNKLEISFEKTGNKTVIKDFITIV